MLSSGRVCSGPGVCNWKRAAPAFEYRCVRVKIQTLPLYRAPWTLLSPASWLLLPASQSCHHLALIKFRTVPKNSGFLFLGTPGGLGIDMGSMVLSTPSIISLPPTSAEQFSFFMFSVSGFCVTSCPLLTFAPAFPANAPEHPPRGSPGSVVDLPWNWSHQISATWAY